MNCLRISRQDSKASPATFRCWPLSGFLAVLLSLGGMAWQTDIPALDAPAARVTAPAVPTAEQIRAAINEAEKLSATAFQPDPNVPKSIEDRWGVQVIRIDYTADGYWLGFRFRVTDVEKALPLFDSRIKPYVEAENTGVRLGVPMVAKIGALRTTNRGGNIKAGKIYTMIFGNVGAQVKPGDKVSVVVGDFKVEHLRVS